MMLFHTLRLSHHYMITKCLVLYTIYMIQHFGPTLDRAGPWLPLCFVALRSGLCTSVWLVLIPQSRLCWC